MNIYVSNLNYATQNSSLEALFAEYGEVSSANIITDRESGRSRGFGFVEMPNDEEGQKAIDALNDSQFEGKTIVVNVARPRTEHNDRSGGYGRGDNNRGGGYNRGGYNRNRY